MGKVNKGDIIEIRIDDLAFGGAGVGRLDGYVVFVKGAVTGDLVRARVHKRKKDYAEASLHEIVEPSSNRIEAPCPYFGACGGCSWQNLAYAKQLETKRSLVLQALERIGGVESVEVAPILPSPVDYRYRNKMDFTFGISLEEGPAIGFHRPNDFRRVLDIEACLIQPEVLDRALGAARGFLRDMKLSCYDPVTHQGFMRHLLFRHSVATGEIVVVATSVTPAGAAPDYADLARRLREACPEMRGFVWGANDSVADVATMQSVLYREGEDWIEEWLGDVRFRVSAWSFFQTNTRAAKVLYDAIADCLDLDGTQTVLDAYCGAGSIGIYCASHAKAVWGLELVKEAVWDARVNAALNGLDNCRFVAGDIRRTLRLAVEGLGGRPDCLIVDPPRGGMHKKALAGLIALRAPALVYVSCNPTTLARDVVEIIEAGYRLTNVQPVDLFPQTYHVETVCRFDLPSKMAGPAQ